MTPFELTLFALIIIGAYSVAKVLGTWTGSALWWAYEALATRSDNKVGQAIYDYEFSRTGDSEEALMFTLSVMFCASRRGAA